MNYFVIPEISSYEDARFATKQMGGKAATPPSDVGNLNTKRVIVQTIQNL